MDILVDEQTSFVPPEFSRKLRNIKVYWWFEIKRPDDIAHVVSIEQANQVEALILN